ncbi:hypothetical protein QTN25_007852 [Entamoeba marina]
MIGLILYNGIENIKSNTHLVPNEIYVLISGFAFTNILYILVCCYHTYCIIRSHRTIKQFLTILLFCVSVGILLVITTYNMYYIRLIPPISFESTLTFSYEFILMGLACLTFGFYNTNNDYSIVNDEIPLEDEKIAFPTPQHKYPLSIVSNDEVQPLLMMLLLNFSMNIFNQTILLKMFIYAIMKTINDD